MSVISENDVIKGVISENDVIKALKTVDKIVENLAKSDFVLEAGTNSITYLKKFRINMALVIAREYSEEKAE